MKNLAETWRLSGRGKLLMEGLAWAAVAGLLLQGAVSIATLRFWFEHHTSFYLPFPGGGYPGTYLAQLALWPVAFVLLAFGRRTWALGTTGAAAMLSVTNEWLNSALFGHAPVLWLGVPAASLALGMTLLGVVPAVAVLLTHDRKVARLRWPPVWVGVLALLGLSLSLTSDGHGSSLHGSASFMIPPYPFPGHNTFLGALIGLWLVAIVGALAAWRREPRATLALAVLTIPFVILAAWNPYGAGLSLESRPWLYSGVAGLFMVALLGLGLVPSPGSKADNRSDVDDTRGMGRDRDSPSGSHRVAGMSRRS